MKRLIIFAAGALVAASVLADNNDASGVAEASGTAKGSPAAVSTPIADMKLDVELKIGSDVQNREVVGETASFGADTEKVVAWTRVTGATQPVQIMHVWKHDGKEISRVPLNVQSASYRTFSRRSVAGMAGAWNVEVQDSAGKTLASKDFTVGK